MTQFKLPTYEQLIETVKLFELDLNAKLSNLGRRQLLDLKMILNQEKFWDEAQYDLCVFSPLVRTKETCFAVVPDHLHAKCIPLKELEEVAPIEQLFRFYLKARIQQFEQWLFDAPVKQLLLVGHCQYLSKMLKLKNYMRNCDVCRSTATFSVDPRSGAVTCAWSEPVLLHRTDLSIPHPIEGIFSRKSTGSTASEGEGVLSDKPSAKEGEDGDNGDVDNNKPEEPCCRICQVICTYEM